MGTNNRFFVCVFFSSSKTNTKMSMLRSSSASIKEEAVTQTSFFTAPSPTYSTFLANAAGTPGDYFSIAQSPQSLLQSVNSPMIPPGTPGTPLDSLSAIATQISHQESGVLRASTDSFHQPEEPAIVSIKTEPTNEANDTRRSRRSTSPTRDIKLSVPPRRRSKTMSRSGKNGSPHEPVDQQCNVSNLKLIFHFSIFSKNQTKPKK